MKSYVTWNLTWREILSELKSHVTSNLTWHIFLRHKRSPKMLDHLQTHFPFIKIDILCHIVPYVYLKRRAKKCMLHHATMWTHFSGLIIHMLRRIGLLLIRKIASRRKIVMKWTKWKEKKTTWYESINAIMYIQSDSPSGLPRKFV